MKVINISISIHDNNWLILKQKKRKNEFNLMDEWMRKRRIRNILEIQLIGVFSKKKETCNNDFRRY